MGNSFTFQCKQCLYTCCFCGNCSQNQNFFSCRHLGEVQMMLNHNIYRVKEKIHQMTSLQKNYGKNVPLLKFEKEKFDDKQFYYYVHLNVVLLRVKLYLDLLSEKNYKDFFPSDLYQYTSFEDNSYLKTSDSSENEETSPVIKELKKLELPDMKELITLLSDIFETESDLDERILSDLEKERMTDIPII